MRVEDKERVWITGVWRKCAVEMSAPLDDCVLCGDGVRGLPPYIMEPGDDA